MKNESELLEQCLESVSSADEIIAVDTGSQDHSVTIAKHFGAKVLHYNWDEDFSKPRNFALKHATTDWIIYVDADECLRTDLDAIRKLLYHSDAAAYTVNIVNLLGSLPEDQLIHRSTRLFRNYQGYQFQGRIHEQIDSSIIVKQNHSTIKDSEITIHHFGYLPSQIANKNKVTRNLKLLNLALKEQPENPYYLYHIGITYCQSRQLAEAVSAMEQALALAPVHASYRPTIIRDCCKIKLELGEVKQSVTLLRSEIKRYTDYPDLHMLLGQSLEASGLLDEAYEAYHCATKHLGNNYVTEAGMSSYRPLSNMAAIAFRRNQLQDAARLYNDALKSHPHYAPALLGIAEAFYRLNVSDQEITSFLANIVSPHSAQQYSLIIEALYHIGAYHSIIDFCPPHLILESRFIEAVACAQIQTGQYTECNRILNYHCSRSENEARAYDFHLWAICQWILYGKLQEDFLLLVTNQNRTAYLEIDNQMGHGNAQSANSDTLAGDATKNNNQLVQSLVQLSISLGQLELAHQLSAMLPDQEQRFAGWLYQEGYLGIAADRLLTLNKSKPLNEKSLFILAELVADKGHYIQAAELFEQIIAANPEHEHARAGAALCYLHLAEQSLQEAMRNTPDDMLFKEDMKRIRSSIRLLNDTGWHSEWTGRRWRIAHGAANDNAMHDRQK